MGGKGKERGKGRKEMGERTGLYISFDGFFDPLTSTRESKSHGRGNQTFL